MDVQYNVSMHAWSHELIANTRATYYGVWDE